MEQTILHLADYETSKRLGLIPIVNLFDLERAVGAEKMPEAEEIMSKYGILAAD